MFSDHLQKVNHFPRIHLLVAAAALVMVCQLVALALVADHQVKQATVRDLQRAAQQVAMADCVERSTGATRHGCIRQTQTVMLADGEGWNSGGRGRVSSVRNLAAADGSAAAVMTGLVPVGLAQAR
ncbi:MAG: hypothetical protein B7X59_09200 [Polaromonas sp. 39-63-203]|jgi:hypothetical protein|uniref:hypothetical protein n=1 Tax=Polaromonas sp. TaxID=1869339 RepID=UPI000BD26583|nr:hypothetical protein [Polaromonas sp.]OYY51449.1 MAG: hypothetical protein B7Y54_10295 [Polaromonas sp. 35-63-240]OYY96063.1 MAG: hypothetical protein B7Y42_10245 [Polaromonas sp. 28-63-22]OYZ83377.1 MAG: hypothetical protein B7Y03_09560 [Polaromonas sp. 24-62-144]OZA96762.1 MAG: hypothetical protein B7X59_09200 [Polaromonas sp. 39-63-203]HQS32016.1 hypothetical protein [Polaromonas sp.]